MSWSLSASGDVPLDKSDPVVWQDAEKAVFADLIDLLAGEHGLVSAHFAGQQFTAQYPEPVPPPLQPLSDEEQQQLASLLARQEATQEAAVAAVADEPSSEDEETS